MHRLRSLSFFAPLFLGACSLVNAPADVDSNTTTASTGGTGGTGGATGGGGDTTTTPTDFCGDGKITAPETCDDNNMNAGDGCSDTCQPEPGYVCMGTPSHCNKTCGNGKSDPGEDCDDGNQVSGDGCDENCTMTGCGNGVMTSGEKCDDGNTIDGDGCDTNCTVTGCGNGIVTMGEQCDDGGATDPDLSDGNQDACSPTCKVQEFDVASAMDAAINNESPIVAFRKTTLNGTDEPTFVVYWHAAADNKIIGRTYTFDGNATGPTPDDYGVSPSPDARGECAATAASNRTLLFWHDGNGGIWERKTDSNSTISPPLQTPLQQPQPRPSCAASPDPHNTFITSVVGKVSGGPQLDVLVQGYNSFAAEQGNPIDIGDTTGAGDTAAWSLKDGFMVGWNSDPLNATGGKIVSQQLDDTGKAMGGFFFVVTDAGDPFPKNPVGAWLGPQDQFVFGYTRDSAPDMGGLTHREVAIRVFSSPGNSLPPFVPATDPNAQGEPRIAANPTNHKFVVVWTSGLMMAENTFYRVYSANGTPVTDPTIANDNQLGSQTSPGVAVDPKSGDVVIVWDSQTAGKPHKVVAKVFPGLLN